MAMGNPEVVSRRQRVKLLAGLGGFPGRRGLGPEMRTPSSEQDQDQQQPVSGIAAEALIGGKGEQDGEPHDQGNGIARRDLMRNQKGLEQTDEREHQQSNRSGDFVERDWLSAADAVGIGSCRRQHPP